jgi:uncharacterized protein
VGLVEDELLLALPAVPLHEDGSCAGLPAPSGDECPPEDATNPFAVLAALRDRGKNEN